ncbi:hypothetical protein POTOM_054416 [Populus tomentosa]|uniref:Uncharacterized protein n=1 Tax=Populus tomentosa TaxID=118781 RepID=A0A8X8C352_POPTO|nr:hypothetical protein POTOM_054416 [Populus tomentosa]
MNKEDDANDDEKIPGAMAIPVTVENEEAQHNRPSSTTYFFWHPFGASSTTTSMKLPWSFIRSPCSIFRKPYVTRLSHRQAKVTIEGTSDQKREMSWNSINIVVEEKQMESHGRNRGVVWCGGSLESSAKSNSKITEIGKLAMKRVQHDVTSSYNGLKEACLQGGKSAMALTEKRRGEVNLGKHRAFLFQNRQLAMSAKPHLSG